MTSWTFRRLSGAAADLHHREFAERPAVEVLEVTRAAVVLGSAQPEADVDQDASRAAGVDVARRASGGGAVLLVPGRHLWVDVTIPPGDEHWDDDVRRSFHWLGRVWVSALARHGVTAEVHEGPMVQTPWSRRVCFAGIGPGEVLIGGRKAVGMSQRRTRAGARFQCVVHDAWGPEPLLGLLRLDAAERAAAIVELADIATGVQVPVDDLLDALLDSFA